jgi:hypothetical protein
MTDANRIDSRVARKAILGMLIRVIPFPPGSGKLSELALSSHSTLPRGLQRRRLQPWTAVIPVSAKGVPLPTEFRLPCNIDRFSVHRRNRAGGLVMLSNLRESSRMMVRAKANCVCKARRRRLMQLMWRHGQLVNSAARSRSLPQRTGYSALERP